MKKSIGILGGMGPLATCNMMEKIIGFTSAEKDQDYPRIYVDCNTNIPDRTNAILNGGADPVPSMVESATKLESMGADFLIMPCNTAHYFYNDVSKNIEIPVLHMVEETAKFIKEKGIKKVGLLATSGTVKSKLYTNFLNDCNIDVIIPDDTQQSKVMAMIYDGIKAGNMDFPVDDFMEVIRELKKQEAEIMILGCTELPIVWDRYCIDEAFVDPMEVISKVAITKAGYTLK